MLSSSWLFIFTRSLTRSSFSSLPSQWFGSWNIQRSLISCYLVLATSEWCIVIIINRLWLVCGRVYVNDLSVIKNEYAIAFRAWSGSHFTTCPPRCRTHRIVHSRRLRIYSPPRFARYCATRFLFCCCIKLKMWNGDLFIFYDLLL